MKSFRARLVLSFTLLTALLTALVAAWVYQSAAEALRDDTDRLLRDRAYVLSKSVTPMAMRLAPWMEAFLETDKTGLRVQVVDPEGEAHAPRLHLSSRGHIARQTPTPRSRSPHGGGHKESERAEAPAPHHRSASSHRADCAAGSDRRIVAQVACGLLIE